MINIYYAFIVFVIKPLKWLFSHPKTLIGVVAIAAIGYGYQACNRPDPKVTPQQVELTKEQQLAPTVQQAPDVLQTLSRVYYVAKYTKVSETKVILYSWYEWNGKKWLPQSSTVGVTFDKATTGDFRFLHR